MPLELEEARKLVRNTSGTLRLAIDVGREQLAGGRALSSGAWATIDGLAGQLEEAFGQLEQAERRAGLR